ncbi:MAG: hypothetical protein IPH20_19770 [Bacteroidales bacterium]|nr:hypothetical protein [Bacteroidales bacterium]
MKAGIYIPGLGEAFRNESVDKYAERFMHELDVNDADASAVFSLKQENEHYGGNAKLETRVVTIIKHFKDKEEFVYRFYDFNYAGILTSKFNAYNIFVKSALLLWLVFSKIGLVMYRLLYNKKGQWYSAKFKLVAFYSIILLLALAVFGIIQIPSALAAFISFSGDLSTISGYFNLSKDALKQVESFSVSITALGAILYTIVPGAGIYLASLASEFISANNYVAMGTQMQRIQGELDALVEHIAEKEGQKTRIHLHAYSFGCIIALDQVFPLSNSPTKRMGQMLEAIVTTGCPYDFIYTYYPEFYKNRNAALKDKFTWYNIYSSADALGTNFMKDNRSDDPMYGIGDTGQLPKNLRYEVTNSNPFRLSDFFMLQAFKVHQVYWDHSALGQSCLRHLVTEMEKDKLIGA